MPEDTIMAVVVNEEIRTDLIHRREKSELSFAPSGNGRWEGGNGVGAL